MTTTTNARATTKVDENSNSFVVNELILALKDGFLYPAKIIDMRRLEDGSSGGALFTTKGGTKNTTSGWKRKRRAGK